MRTYSEKLKDPRWQRKRLEIMERDGFACRNCGSTTTTLHIHHVRYLKGREPWEYKDFYLVTLCEHCHKQEEADIKAVSSRPKTNAAPSPFDLLIDSAPESPSVKVSTPDIDDINEFFSDLKGLLSKV